MSWGGDIELEARDLPDWTEGQSPTWTIASGLGSLNFITDYQVKYFGPDWGPEVPPQTLITLYVGDQLLGECTITLKTIMPKIKPEPLPGLPKPPEPDPPPTEEEVVPTVDCGVDPEFPDQPLKIRPTEVMTGPEQEVSIGIVKIWEVCEEGCYTWRIASGGGKLLCNCGRTAIYLPPKINGMCEDNAVIDLIYCERVIASCYVTINTWGRAGEAYVTYDRNAHWDFGKYDPAWRGQHEVAPPAGVMGPSWHLRDYLHIHDCNDRIIRDFDYLHQWWHATWWPIGQKWIIWCSHHCINYAEYYTFAEINIRDHRPPYKQTKDLRRSWMKEGGCCPVGLIGVAYFFE